MHHQTWLGLTWGPHHFYIWLCREPGASSEACQYPYSAYPVRPLFKGTGDIRSGANGSITPPQAERPVAIHPRARRESGTEWLRLPAPKPPVAGGHYSPMYSSSPRRSSGQSRLLGGNPLLVSKDSSQGTSHPRGGWHMSRGRFVNTSRGYTIRITW